jgi:hypothetical protein
MSWRIRSLAVLAFFSMALPALACINDNESSEHEREFRSQYGNTNMAFLRESGYKPPVSQSMLLVSGVVMLGVSGVVLVKNLRSKD